MLHVRSQNMKTQKLLNRQCHLRDTEERRDFFRYQLLTTVVFRVVSATISHVNISLYDKSFSS